MATEGTLQTDGRRLTYLERGAKDGTPLFLLHGTPGSRLTRYPDTSEYERRNLRVITYDRPGYGKSEPDLGRVVASAADDIRAIADELGLERFATFGVSGGAPHSLACAALLSDRITRAGAMVTPAPYDSPGLDFLEGMTELNVKEFSAALKGEDALAGLLQPFVEEAQADPEQIVAQIEAELPPVDQAVLHRPEVREVLRDSMAESVRQGARGWIDDDLAFTKPWGFDLSAIEAEVGLWQGELDVLAPRAHGEYVARRLPNGSFHLIPGAGHMVFDEWPAVFDWLVGP